MSTEQRLYELGIDLPQLLPAAGLYLRCKRHGDLVFVSGHGPVEAGATELGAGNLVRGKVGANVTMEEARRAARLTGLQMLASLRGEIGSLDRVRSIQKVAYATERLAGADWRMRVTSCSRRSSAPRGSLSPSIPCAPRLTRFRPRSTRRSQK